MINTLPLLLLCLLSVGVLGCAGSGSSPSAASSSNKIPPGMNSTGEVVDSSLVSEGHGKKVEGRDGWTGEILGKVAPGSRFSRLQIGMPVAEVVRLLGSPSDQGAYITGQAFNPFWYGSGKSRYEMVYKNQGRLIFDSPSAYSGSSPSLVWIINSSKERGYR